MPDKPFFNRTAIITGSSRGIGRAFALALARGGANVVVASKTAEPHPKLPGDIHQVAAEVEHAGGQALPVQVDVRDEEGVHRMVEAAVSRFGGIDILINNAGAINLTKVEATPPKRFDLMIGVNARAVYLASRAALPHLRKSENPHILSLCPPLPEGDALRRWLGAHAPYSLSKFGMTMLSLGMAEEFRRDGIAVNCLWPRTIIATAAIEFAVGSRDMFKMARTPEIMADAALGILSTPAAELTGRCLIDEDFLRERGETDFAKYLHDPSFTGKLIPDIFI